MRRLLARIEAALLDRHARNVVMAAAKATVRNPGATGSGAITTKGATMTSKAPSSDSVSLTDFLAQMPGTQLLINERVDALRATIIGLTDALAEALKVVAERDATIERLWAQLNEATNMPEECDHTALSRMYRRERNDARAEVERVKNLVCDREDSIIEKDDAMFTAMRNLVANDAAIVLLTKERDEALALVVDLQTGLVSALTTGGRLRVERDEARDKRGD